MQGLGRGGVCCLVALRIEPVDIFPPTTGSAEI